MSGVFSLGKDLLFSYLADAGHPVSPHGALYVFGRLSWAAFVISALVAWWFEHRQVTQLQTRLNSLTDEKTRRRAIYDHLSRFLIAADKIKRVCSNPEHVIPTESAEKWEIEVARYIRTNLGESESNRFIYETNVPPAP